MNNQKIVMGILAHVDAGKTTLSESLLYQCKTIKTMGRVDHKDAFLDTFQLEKERGITIFSKQAQLRMGEYEVTLLDTPGHVDFSAEMERTLPLLDYAILVVNGADGVQGHTKTLWHLLFQYKIPTFIFVNKMDQVGADKVHLQMEIKEQLSQQIVDFTSVSTDPIKGIVTGEEAVLETLALCDEEVMEQYLEQGEITVESLRKMIKTRQTFPCFYGSALKIEGVEELIQGLETYMVAPEYPKDFAARIYKIARDDQGNRLTYMKITGGRLKVRELLAHSAGEEGECFQEKVNQIRIYSGEHYQSVTEVEGGTVCAVTGLTKTYAGEGLGTEKKSYLPMLEPVLNYQILIPEELDVHQVYLQLKQLEEEEPLLRIVWNKEANEIHAQLMGEIQCEIVKNIMKQRFSVDVAFGDSKIVYKETITEPVEGVGHFEPLRHYAEVHILLEPGARGSGVQLDSNCSEDVLDKNWQRLILTHLSEKVYRGTLLGAEVTDIKMTVVAGKAHKKHTEGGDFRQATYRGVRQGLKKAAESGCGRILEPVYEFTLDIPADRVGRAMTDIEAMYGQLNPPELLGNRAVLTGWAPVATMGKYQKEVMAYTHGEGSLTCTLKGYEPCHNPEEVIKAYAYDSEEDVADPTSSVFCAHGAGFIVPWYEVSSYMHVDSEISSSGGKDMDEQAGSLVKARQRNYSFDVTEDEIEEIFLRTYGSKKKKGDNSEGSRIIYGKDYEEGNYDQNHGEKVVLKQYDAVYKPQPRKEKYLLVDGYNIIFAWEELKHLAEGDLHGARTRLMDIMCNYQAYRKMNLILVFDAYKVVGNPGEVFDYKNIHVVYTKEAETADQYIEKVTHEMGHRYDVMVATSDALEQLIVLGNGASRISARGFLEEVQAVEQEIRERYLSK